MSLHDHPDDFFVDHNGRLAERYRCDGLDVEVHYDDIPESDITTVHGIRCTTALRTVIDVAVAYGPVQLEDVVRHCFERRLFSYREALERIARPDMRNHPGAALLARVLHSLGGER